MGDSLADVSLPCEDQPLEHTEPHSSHPIWRMVAGSGIVRCGATASGTMSYTPEWKPTLVSATTGWELRLDLSGQDH